MRSLAITCALVLGLVVSNRAEAIPILQLYIEGGTYNTSTESWEVTLPSSSGTFRLWAIGNVAQHGSILDVRMAFAFSEADLGMGLTLTQSTTGGYGGAT